MSDFTLEPGQAPGLVRIGHATDRLLSRIEQAMAVVACAALPAVMAILFLDGVLRYLLNSPLTFATDIVTLYLLSAGLLLTLAYTLRQGGHISVDMFATMMNWRGQALLLRLSLLAAVPVIAIMGYELGKSSWDSWIRGETLVGLHALPLWLSRAIVAVSFIPLNLRLLHLALFDFLAGLTGNRSLAYPLEGMENHPEEEGV
jgi:TRAP-type C4-dicarboxylate transport system permease small subunit